MTGDGDETEPDGEFVDEEQELEGDDGVDEAL